MRPNEISAGEVEKRYDMVQPVGLGTGTGISQVNLTQTVELYLNVFCFINIINRVAGEEGGGKKLVTLVLVAKERDAQRRLPHRHLP
jgi:hypothetical protein